MAKSKTKSKWDIITIGNIISPDIFVSGYGVIGTYDPNQQKIIITRRQNNSSIFNDAPDIPCERKDIIAKVTALMRLITK